MRDVTPGSLHLRYYLVDASLSSDTLDTLRREIARLWYAGESNPTFLQKIPELRAHPMTASAHRDAVHRVLTSFGKIDEKVHPNEEEEEDEAREGEPSQGLARLYPQGELSLYFAGPCVMFDIDARVMTESDYKSLQTEVEHALRALESLGPYQLIEGKTSGKMLTANDVANQLRARWQDALDRETQIARQRRRSLVLYWIINTLFGLALLWLLIYGVQQLLALQAVNLSERYTFVVHQKFNENSRAVFPALRAAGIIRETGESVTLKLFKDEYHTIATGYELSVLKTQDPDEPYRLAWYVEKHSPFSLGPVKVNVELVVWTVFTLGWGFSVRKYLKTTSEARRDDLRRSLANGVFWVGGVFLLIVTALWLKGILQ